MTHRARRHRLLLTLGLAVSLFLLSASTHATPPLPEPPQSISDRPELKFLTPASGARLTGAAPFIFGAGAVDKIKRWHFGTLANGLFGKAYPVGSLRYNTLLLANGPHTFIVRATYESGAVAEARLDAIVYNPSHQLRRIDHSSDPLLDGQDAILELTYNEPGLRLELDFSELDSNFDARRVRVNEASPGVYRIVYPISRTNKVPPGRHQVRVRAINAAREAVSNAFEWELRKRPLMPLMVTGCEFLSTREQPRFRRETRDSIPHVTLAPQLANVVPRKVHLAAAGLLEVGRPTRMHVSWTDPLPGPKPDAGYAQARVLVTVEDRTGYYPCWVPQGETHAILTLALKAPGAYSNIPPSDALPNHVLLKVAVERADYVEGWQRHAFKVTLPAPRTHTLPPLPPAPPPGVSGRRKQKTRG